MFSTGMAFAVLNETLGCVGHLLLREVSCNPTRMCGLLMILCCPNGVRRSCAAVTKVCGLRAHVFEGHNVVASSCSKDAGRYSVRLCACDQASIYQVLVFCLASLF
jgi:hypothetical protein